MAGALITIASLSGASTPLTITWAADTTKRNLNILSAYFASSSPAILGVAGIASITNVMTDGGTLVTVNTANIRSAGTSTGAFRASELALPSRGLTCPASNLTTFIYTPSGTATGDLVIEYLRG